MVDFVQKLIDDLPQQFKERERIEQLYMVIGKQFQDIYNFYEQLKAQRFISTASGEQLDGIGEIVVMDRNEARRIMELDRPITDEEYRQILFYKAMMNYGTATYKDIMTCLKLLRGDLGVSYTEDYRNPATIIFELDISQGNRIIHDLLSTPIPRAAGVGMLLRSNAGDDIKLVTGVTTQKYLEITATMDRNDMNGIVFYADEHAAILSDHDDMLLVEGHNEGD